MLTELRAKANNQRIGGDFSASDHDLAIATTYATEPVAAP